MKWINILSDIQFYNFNPKIFNLLNISLTIRDVLSNKVLPWLPEENLIMPYYMEHMILRVQSTRMISATIRAVVFPSILKLTWTHITGPEGDKEEWLNSLVNSSTRISLHLLLV